MYRHAPAPVNPDSAPQVQSALLARIANGDRQALAELYDHQSALLYSVILKILNDPAEAEDVLQDVFLQIWDKAAHYDPTLGKPLSWAVALTRNKALDRLRSTQRRRDAFARSLEVQPSPVVADADDVNHREIAHLVQSAVRDLPKDQRQAIEMAFFSGLTQSEVAERLQVPLGTIKARIRRGMMRLQDALKHYL